ncbi:MAG: hypothetical protein M5U01_16290 [Ardenticatenaceae bacterium]|nr:hypothetical protein [Ardenticatenaceae bacterium]
MENGVTLDQVLDLVQQLSLVDKVRLIERVAPQIERELETVQPTPRKSLRGLWQGIDITDEDIAAARQEMWGNFPRNDF